MKLVTINKRRDVLHIKNNGKRFFCKFFTVIAVKRQVNSSTSEISLATNNLKTQSAVVTLKHNKEPRIIFVVSKKNGNAVNRNRIKRRLRTVARNHFSQIGQANFDYMFIARRSLFDGDFQEISHFFTKSIVVLNKKY